MYGRPGVDRRIRTTGGRSDTPTTWPDRSAADILEWTGEEDYHLIGGFDDEELIGVAGVLVQHVLHHDQHAWLYDLVVAECRRNEGHGSALVEFVEEWADRNGCEHVALASPLGKTDVHEWYERRGYEAWGYVIEKSL